MNFKNNFKKLVLLSVSAVFIYIISLLHQGINTSIEENKLRDTGKIENAPPMVAFTTIAFGAFRGVIANLLWLRAKSLQDQRNYFEMVQIASWIQQLQPKFTGAISFMAWNMSYNISASCSNFEDRWKWINKGIELYLDSIDANPEDPELYKELSWLFYAKISSTTDDASQFYRNKYIAEYTELFGGGTPDWNDWAKEPISLDEFKKLYKKDKLLQSQMKRAGISSFSALYDKFLNDLKIDSKLKDLINDEKKSQLLEKRLRVLVLTKRYRLIPAKIIEIEKKYGKLEWRLPEAQGLYWTHVGMKVSKAGYNKEVERLLLMNLRMIFHQGTILTVGKGEKSKFFFGVNLNVADAVVENLIIAEKKYKNASFNGLLDQFIRDAMIIFDTYGRYKKADEYYKMLKKYKIDDDRYDKLPKDAYIMIRSLENIRSTAPRQAGAMIVGLVINSVIYLIEGQQEAATALSSKAKQYYIYYQKTTTGRERLQLPPYRQLEGVILQNIVNNFSEKKRNEIVKKFYNMPLVGPSGKLLKKPAKASQQNQQ